MKPIILLLFLICSGFVSGQVSITTTAAVPDESAMLDVVSNEKGLLIPRMTLAQKINILEPATSLLIYQTDGTEGFYYNAGTTVSPNWQLLGGEDLLLSSRIPISELPYTVSASGSYYLTDHLSGTIGIDISVSNVTIDLNGYSIVAAAGASGDGISTDGDIENIKVINGSCIGWSDKGIDLRDADYCQVSNITAQNNAGDGIECGDHSQITHCIVSGNTFDGIDLGKFGTVSFCSTSGNGDNGIELDDYGKVQSCNSVSNSGDGVQCQKYATITNSTFTENTGNGATINAGGSINKTTASSNTLNGFNINTACTLSGNIARDNGTHGYTLLSDCYLDSNISDGNSNAGFFTTSSDVRFDSNHATDNGTYGFDVISSFGCSLIKNTANSNSAANYNLSANNAAPMVTSASINTATNPFANINF